MPDTTIDTLQVKITANAKSASEALRSLASALNKVRDSLTVAKDGLTATEHLNRNLVQMNSALNSINTSSIKRLQKLANALNDYSFAVKRIANVGAVAQSIRSVEKALGGRIGDNGYETANDVDVSVFAPDQIVDNIKISEEQVRTIVQKISFDYFGKLADRMKEVIASFKRVRDAAVKVGNAFKKAFSHVKKFADSIHTSGKKAKESSSFFGTFVKSIGRIAFYRAIRSAIKGVGEAFSEGLKNAYYYSKQTEDLSRLAETLDRIASKTSQLVNQLGAFWGEIKQFIAPALEWIVEQIRKIADYLTELFAALNGDDYFQRALLEAKYWDEAADNLNKYKHQLLGLDELNNLSKKNDTDKELEKAKEAFEDVAVRPEFQSIGRTWQNVRKSISDALDGIYGDLLLPTATAALGAILLFTGHPFAGVSMIVTGMKLASDKLKMNDELRGEIEGFFKEYEALFNFGSTAVIAIGTLLLFVPGKTLLGLGLLLSGIAFKRFVKDPVNFNWGEMIGEVFRRFVEYRELFSKIGAAAVAIGALLLFVPGMHGIGLGLILAGTAVKTLADAKDFSWNELLETINKKFEEYKAMFEKIAPAAVAIGSILLFIPGMQGIGLGLILAGTAVQTLAQNENIEWDELLGKITEKFEKIMGLFEVGSLIAGALGVILLFVPGLRGAGLHLIKMAAPGLFATALTGNWDGLLKSLKEAWEDIRYWWNTTVKNGVNTAINWLEEQSGILKIDINGDGQIGGLYTNFGTTKNTMGRAKRITGESGVYLRGQAPEEPEEQSTLKKIWNTVPFQSQAGYNLGHEINDTLKDIGKAVLKDWLDPNNYGGTVKWKAAGGIVNQGSLFYAGEAGAEFVGNIGSTSAVANTGQMTEAIYKAAYMGMSKALKENGGGGMNGFEPATTDDLFIAMRKKASNYNKMTGNSAFA